MKHVQLAWRPSNYCNASSWLRNRLHNGQTDGQMDRRTDVGHYNIPFVFFLKVGNYLNMFGWVFEENLTLWVVTGGSKKCRSPPTTASTKLSETVECDLKRKRNNHLFTEKALNDTFAKMKTKSPAALFWLCWHSVFTKIFTNNRVIYISLFLE